MKRRYHLRMPFWIYCGLTLLVAAAAMNSGYNLLYWVFGVMASALLLSGIVSGAMMMGLAARRHGPPHGVVGEAMSIRYVVRNRNRLFPVFNIHFEELASSGADNWDSFMSLAPAWVMHAGPQESVHGEAVFWPQRRGVVRFDRLRIWTTFPFGIVRKSVTASQAQRFLVYPRLFMLRRRVLEAIAPAGTIGTRISAHAGAGDDYYGLREFRHGDSMRHIAWKRTANRDELVCIERTRPTPPKLRVVLNLTTPTDELRVGEDEKMTARELEETAISLAASIVHAADMAGCEVGLTILGDPREPIPVRRSHWHRNRLLAALAEIDLDALRQAAREHVVADLEPAGVVVVHPDRPDLSIMRGEAWHFTARQLDHLVEHVAGRSEHQPRDASGLSEAKGATAGEGEVAA